jgi:hypothetical protein
MRPRWRGSMRRHAVGATGSPGRGGTPTAARPYAWSTSGRRGAPGEPGACTRVLPPRAVEAEGDGSAARGRVGRTTEGSP